MSVLNSRADSLGYLLGHISGVLHRQSEQTLQERLGIGLSQFKILMTLQWRPHVTQRELADFLGQTEASISRQVKLLLERGMLVTHIDPAERRRHLTTPTAKGLKLSRAARDILSEYHQPVFDTLNTKEQEQLLASLKRLHQYICAPDTRLSCGGPADIEAVFENQKDISTN